MLRNGDKSSERFLSLEQSTNGITIVPSKPLATKIEHQFLESDWRLELANLEEAALESLELLQRRWSSVDDEERQKVWDEGWREAFNNYQQDGSLVAGFTHPTTMVNVDGTYFRPIDSNFEINYQALIRSYVLDTYFEDCTAFIEFGSGSGINLVAAAKRLPSVRIIGSDFVPAAVELHNAIAAKTGYPIESYLFDMRAPISHHAFPKGSSVLTYGSVEQLGNNFQPFLDFLLEMQPKVVVHVETDSSFLLDGKLPDFIAKSYSEVRGYPNQFLGRLLEMQNEERIRIVTTERSVAYPGLTPGNNLFVWVPA